MKTVKFRNFSNANKSKFSRSISAHCSTFRILSDDVNFEIARFISWMKSVNDKFFPVKIKQLSEKRFRAPWLSQSIIQCIRKKHLWYRMFMAGLIAYGSYRAYCKLLQRLIRTAERSYFESKFKAMGPDSKSN